MAKNLLGMEKEKFRQWAQSLGLKTGTELEKRMEFKNAEIQQTGTENESTLPDFAVQEMQNDFFLLPQNYTNRYNLIRGDFPPIEVSEALNMCLDKFGAVDIEYIASLSLLSLKDVILSLGSKIYRDPDFEGELFFKGWIYEEEYLSGNLMRKYNKLKEIPGVNKTVYAKNIKALENVLPPKPQFSDLYLCLGAPWIPAKYITDFVQYLYRVSVVRNKRICEVVYQREIAKWTVVLNVDVRSTVLASKTYGTERMDMFKILEKTLNHEQIRIADNEVSGEKKSRKLNREQTMLAEEKRTRLKEAFVSYLSTLPQEQKQELVDIYYNKYCTYIPRRFDGQSYTFKGNVKGVTLYDYQRTAVVRIMRSKSTLLAHDVGAGKTYAMIAAAHEMFLRRNNFKNMIVVPNSILAQWAIDYKLLYPDANVLVVAPQDFTPQLKAQTLVKMRDGNYESILISYSTFEMIESGFIQAEKDAKDKVEIIDKALQNNMLKKVKIRNKLNGLLQKEKSDLLTTIQEYHKKQKELENTVTFEDLSITALFIDEAHNYKNLPLESSLGQIKGINVEGSQKCADVYLKTRTISAKEGGRLIFATGTPVTNSVADIFVMQKYLANDNLIFSDVDHFDNWAGTFGEVTRGYEIDVDTENYRITTRFNKFNNLSELSKMINYFTDFQVADKDGLPTVESIKTVVVQKTALQKQLLSEISERVDKIRAGEVERKEDNLLKVTTDGRKLALDARLVTEEEGHTGNKIQECALKVASVYYKNPGKTQLVFCDIGTPKQGYNVYDHLKSKLVAFGIGEEEIGFVHDATSDQKRAKLFESVNNGAIRVLIGSTFKLGTGVNVQEKLIAIHHLDVPWRPSDMVQREGRLVRKGNTNEKVFIYRYVTDGSFDAYSWQLLENKQRFITELLTGTAKGADERRLDDAVLSYAEVKALAIGNPLVKSRVETVNEIARVKTLYNEEQKRICEVEYIKNTLPNKIAELKLKLKEIRQDSKLVQELPEVQNKMALGELITKTVNENAMSTKEIFIASIGAFKIFLPANFNKIHPYLVVLGHSRYTVDLNTFGIGAVIKIENFLASLEERAKLVYRNLSGYEMQLKQAQSAMDEREKYLEKINELNERLKEIDKQIGIQ
ncbi:MAG: DEAD/DEAH box helicase family protein [Clostridia bacterium]|nr:DEAD/DEAH box helicase family protein [Clostridia bacterium]